MFEYDIIWSDLTEECQRDILEQLKECGLDDETFDQTDIFPLTTLIVEE